MGSAPSQANNNIFPLKSRDGTLLWFSWSQLVKIGPLDSQHQALKYLGEISILSGDGKYALTIYSSLILTGWSYNILTRL